MPTGVSVIASPKEDVGFIGIDAMESMMLMTETDEYAVVERGYLATSVRSSATSALARSAGRSINSGLHRYVGSRKISGVLAIETEIDRYTIPRREIT
jgi:hypothetical protein